jgi:hypothetical protein
MLKVKIALNTKDSITPEDMRLGKQRKWLDFRKLFVILYLISRWSLWGRWDLWLVDIRWRPPQLWCILVLSWETVPLGFMNVALDGLDIMT